MILCTNSVVCGNSYPKRCNNILTYLLAPWSRVLLERLASLQLVKKFPAFYGTRRFLTAPTSARHLSLSWAGPIRSSYPNPTSWRSILILSSHLRLGLPSGLFISVNCSTCFGWYLHPSSTAHITVSTVSGITETVTTTCRERHIAVTVLGSQVRPDPARKLLANLYAIYRCCVYSEKHLMMGRGTVRNM